MSSKPTVAISASRLKTCMECSWKYHAKYKLKLPDTTNDGASRGTVCHAVLEVLGKKGRKKYYNTILKEQDVFAIPSVGRLVTSLATKLNVADPENMELINFMTVNGLGHDYFGADKEKPNISFSEKSFDISINENGKRYRILGFIDKLFLYKGQKAALVRDFKTSKKVFEGKEVSDNLQDLVYSLAVKHLFPDYSFRESEFLFLKFELGHDLLGHANEGVLRMESLSDEELEGFEYQLTEWQSYLENFDEDSARSNFALDKGFPPKDEGFSGKLLCGFAKYPGQLKKDGTAMWHCPFKFEFDYYSLKDSSGQLKKNSFIDDREVLEDLLEDGDYIEKLHYDGCPPHRSSSTGEINDEFDF